jgi:hypothetical protein
MEMPEILSTFLQTIFKHLTIVIIMLLGCCLKQFNTIQLLYPSLSAHLFRGKAPFYQHSAKIEVAGLHKTSGLACFRKLR